MTYLGNMYYKFSYHLEQINESAQKNPQDFVDKMEACYQEQIQGIAGELQGHCKVVLLAGPSGSGKTTTAHMLRDQLQKWGTDATIVSLDDFYLGIPQTPRLPNGEYDYESVYALDLEEIHRCLLGLLQEGSCEKPNFDFVTGKPFPHRTKVELGKNGIAIVEGIHALNPAIAQNLPSQGLVKLYLSVKQGIEAGQHQTILEPRDLRFIRRLTRDYRYRGVDPVRMISMWDNVCRGEDLYIHPFQHSSDYTINSIHIYEPCVFLSVALPLLKEIPEDHKEFPYAQRLIRGLNSFVPIAPERVPSTSLLREFIGKD